jgi:hypothetical protein
MKELVHGFISLAHGYGNVQGKGRTAVTYAFFPEKANETPLRLPWVTVCQKRMLLFVSRGVY